MICQCMCGVTPSVAALVVKRENPLIFPDPIDFQLSRKWFWHAVFQARNQDATGSATQFEHWLANFADSFTPESYLF